MQNHNIQSLLLNYITFNRMYPELQSSELFEQFLEYPNRLFVYKNGYISRVKDALLETFGRTAFIFGEQPFEELVFGYLRGKTFSAYDLFEVCLGFPEYISTLKSHDLGSLLEDMAMLELKCARVFHSKGFPPLSLEVLGSALGKKPENVKLRLQPFVLTHSSRWPLVDICNDIKRLREKNIIFDISWVSEKYESEHQVIFRKSWQVICDKLDNAQLMFLNFISGGQNLAEACENLENFAVSKGLNPANLRLHECLCQWVQNEMFIA